MSDLIYQEVCAVEGCLDTHTKKMTMLSADGKFRRDIDLCEKHAADVLWGDAWHTSAPRYKVFAVLNTSKTDKTAVIPDFAESVFIHMFGDQFKTPRDERWMNGIRQKLRELPTKISDKVLDLSEEVILQTDIEDAFNQIMLGEKRGS